MGLPSASAPTRQENRHTLLLGLDVLIHQFALAADSCDDHPMIHHWADNIIQHVTSIVNSRRLRRVRFNNFKPVLVKMKTSENASQLNGFVGRLSRTWRSNLLKRDIEVSP